MTDPFPRRRLVVVLLLVAAGITTAYWVAWYGDRSLVASSTDRAYVDFENAFPVADAWLVLCALLAARALHGRRPAAMLWLLCGGSAGAYLAGMDVLYDLEHGIWFGHGAGGLVELAINVLTVVGSTGALLLGWRHREVLLAGG